jgi:aryl-alcohol dehydrogenase-like predicted oxidoreductase
VKTRPLGKTPFRVSELALGTWGLSGDAYGTVDPSDAKRVLQRALDMGVSLVDTADVYGAGHMETLLGKVLADHPEVLVVTKGGTDRSTTPPRKRFEPSYLRQSVERSLRRLRRERIAIYLLPHPSAEALGRGEVPELLSTLRQEGKLACWGVSAGDSEVGRVALAAGAEVLSLAYNLFHGADLHRLAGEIMVSGAGVLAHSTLAFGLLAGLWTRERVFADGDHRRDRWTQADLASRIAQLDAVRSLVRGEVLTLRAAAVRFVLSNSLVSSALLGPRTVSQLEQLVREVGSGPVYLPDRELADLPRLLDRVGIAS